MGNDMVDQKMIRHNAYLAENVWLALRKRALEEQGNANKIISYLLGEFLDNPIAIPSGKYRARIDDLEENPVKGRSILISAKLSERVLEKISGRTSFSSLVDFLVRKYLVIELGENFPKEVAINHESGRAPDRTAPNLVQAGDTVYDLGNNPFVIDLSTQEEKDKKENRR